MISLAYGVLSSCSKSSHASRSARHQATASHVPVDRARVHGSALSYPSATPATLLRGYSVWLPHLPEGPLDGRVVTATREGVTRRPAGPRACRRRISRDRRAWTWNPRPFPSRSASRGFTSPSKAPAPPGACESRATAPASLPSARRKTFACASAAYIGALQTAPSGSSRPAHAACRPPALSPGRASVLAASPRLRLKMISWRAGSMPWAHP